VVAKFIEWVRPFTDHSAMTQVSLVYSARFSEDWLNRDGVGRHVAKIDSAQAGLYPAEAGPTNAVHHVGLALAGKTSGASAQNRGAPVVGHKSQSC
jgi:hypothetical protein